MNENPALVMIHGLIGSLRYFDPQGRMPGTDVVADDLPGYGRRREVPLPSLTLSAQAEHVAALIDRTSAERVWLLGHSMGGAVAMLAADRRPERIHGVINVEGNFTERDTFWSRRITAQSAAHWSGAFERMRADPAGWLKRAGIEPDPQRIACAEHILAHQPAETLHAMARAIMEETLSPDFLAMVRRVLARGTALHLLAGARSADAWGVPGFVRSAAASYTQQPDAGHMMMLESPDAFCRIVVSVIRGDPSHRIESDDRSG